ncbi:MAG: hypothetical protein ACRDUA_09315 [Micromonosporaceae bacterium]
MGELLSSGEVLDSALVVLDAAAGGRSAEEALIAARDVLGRLDWLTVVRVAAALAYLATCRPAGESSSEWLERLGLEQVWGMSP